MQTKQNWPLTPSHARNGYPRAPLLNADAENPVLNVRLRAFEANPAEVELFKKKSPLSKVR